MRQSKLLFYGKLAEKALQTYERDGWGEFPTQIVVERREIRPTADRGPILLCVDTSGMTSPVVYVTVAYGLRTVCAGTHIIIQHISGSSVPNAHFCHYDWSKSK